MLPSRLFRNTGLPPPLRSLLTPSPTLPASYQVQLRFRLGVTAPSLSAPPPASRSRYSTAASSTGSLSASTNAEANATQETEERTVFKQALGQIKPKLSITFTCTVEGCGERSTHEFTKHAYEKGIVLVQCPGCKNRHLIADHLGWFKESTGDGKMRTIEDILRNKGETVKRGKVDPNGTIEFT
ncbi:hypothetical protein NP233_g13024 [Leucocoprinus birnbaumii]|uniref:DNL-type domain-containing protein n=1 Tax=Leucocoprinus birnbaumii TaxID=56174 RepID=A0AAD5VFU1_9AGAR|nr:hypothetical protein NP233_g13024 [Leucocoprinus birnbaumii]